MADIALGVTGILASVVPPVALSLESDRKQDTPNKCLRRDQENLSNVMTCLEDHEIKIPRRVIDELLEQHRE